MKPTSSRPRAKAKLKTVPTTPSSAVVEPSAPPATPNPWQALTDLQLAYQREFTQLWLSAWSGQQDKKPEPVVAPDADDRRFSATAWDEPYYDLIKQNYLLYERFIMASVEALQIDERERAKLRFHARQFVHALSPANFFATNPVAIKAAVDSQGESIRRGMANLLEDVQRGRISTNDEAAFVVGGNLAITPGSVIYENELMQLIQYAPSTEQVRERPLVIIPPCINKFYIMDLSPKNSFVRWAVEQGNTVFLVSWRNADASTAHLGWDDYISKGVIRAIDLACEVRKVEQVNTLGFCVGGTMLGAALATLAKQGRAPAASATFFATMLDFSDTGEIGNFVDEALVTHFETTMGMGGIRSGRDLASTFYALRENDLIWPYVTNNYLLGKTPSAFDILYWNGDATNLPGPWYCWYLRNTYLENKLREPNAVTVCGEPLDLSLINIPIYMVGTREDHIVPWPTAYKSNEFLKAPRRFVLGSSGHIAGIINPPSANKRSYWTNEALPPTADEWFVGATEQPGSWWTDWDNWLKPFTGEEVNPPRFAGSAKYAPLEDAPGRYVRASAED